ncbi:MAG TPA: alpha-1,2-fucosyltransferase [Bacteroidales bacterium]|nr:alpha-1,2-fucosyltransferase [Bacteroidales bacterium]
MITTHLKGGLGNQMFQIAAAYSLALDNNDECSFFMDNPNINQGHGSRYYTTNVFRNLKELPDNMVERSDYEQIRYMEPRFNFDPIPYRERMVLQGFFQSEKYFANHKEEIVELFGNKAVRKYEFNDCVSLHIRRGDYLDPYTAQFLPVLPMDYYTRALSDLDSKARIDCILVFSDDIAWCKGNLKDPRLVFAERQEDWEDLYTMSKCEHHIIANSSFSWWGAYLNTNVNKIVYAPEKWFGPAVTDDWKDVYCKNWIIL